MISKLHMSDDDAPHIRRPAHPPLDRRAFLRLTTAALGAGLLPRFGRAEDLPAQPNLARFPEKTDLILLTDRPPNLETPLRYFREDFTPNEAFFVRWHLGIVPTSVDAAAFRLAIKGHVQQPQALTLDELRKSFDAVSVVAVNQCSGNSRSLFEPRVPGGQWGNGAIGNAKWTGVRLRDLLTRASPKAGAVDVSFAGLDRAPLPSVANFVKSLEFDHANDGEVIIAYEMNGQPLPMLNGFPLRLIVPGWYATYWVKSLNEITVLDRKFSGFWMDKSYRVPNNPNCDEPPKDLAKETVPISRMTVRSLFVRPEPQERVESGRPVEVSGLAIDCGKGIAKVEVSTDGGRSWVTAKLEREIGKYSWRRWRFDWRPAAGKYRLLARATNAAGETQTNRQWNRSGYARNVIEAVDVTVE
jgi:DMSO/TMAO reductase YedYZ molybdopterin-dependent catalytic subunit